MAVVDEDLWSTEFCGPMSIHKKKRLIGPMLENRLFGLILQIRGLRRADLGQARRVAVTNQAAEHQDNSEN